MSSKPTLGIYQFIHNAEEFDYPVVESIESCIPIADQIVLCECKSTDNTLDILMRLKAKYPSKIKIVHHPWVNHHSQLSMVANYASTFLKTDWKWQLQGDEVLHEMEHEYILMMLAKAEEQKRTAITTKYSHFLGNFETCFPFVYEEIIRIHKSGSPWRLVGDACQLAGGNPDEVLQSNIKVFHYGKVHSGKAGFIKESSFQQLYTDLGFPDPKLEVMKEKLGEGVCDYIFLFEDAIKKGETWKFESEHPKYMKERIQLFKDNGWEQFTSVIKENLSV